MKFNNDLSKQLSAFKKTHSRVQKPKLFNPIREWTVGLALSVLIFITFTGYIGYDFYVQYQGAEQLPVIDESVIMYRQKDVTPIIEMYQNRENEFERLRKNRPQQVITVIAEPNQINASSTENIEPLAEGVEGQ